MANFVKPGALSTGSNYKVTASKPLDARELITGVDGFSGATPLYTADNVYEGLEVQVQGGHKYRFIPPTLAPGEELTDAHVSNMANWKDLDTGETLESLSADKVKITSGGTEQSISSIITNIVSTVSGLQAASSGLISFVGIADNEAAMKALFNPATTEDGEEKNVPMGAGAYVLIGNSFSLTLTCPSNPEDKKNFVLTFDKGDQVILTDTYDEDNFLLCDADGSPASFNVLQSNLTGALMTGKAEAESGNTIAMFTGVDQQVSGATMDSLVAKASGDTGFVKVGSATTSVATLKPVIFDSTTGIPYYKETDAPEVVLTPSTSGEKADGLFKIEYTGSIDEITY